MVDRELTFSDPEIVEMLQHDFVPTAIDQFFQRKQKDAEGEFYRKIASQGPRSDFNSTTQGRYICTPDGKLLGFNNNRGSQRIKKIMRQALAEFDPESVSSVEPIETGTPDARYDYPRPTDGLTLRVNTKVLGGYERADNWRAVFHDVISRDNVWILAEEMQQLAKVIQTGGELPPKIVERIARFHFIDNTRGEPPKWSRDQIKSLALAIDDQGRLSGNVHLETEDGKRGYTAEILGMAEADGERVTRFDLVCKGEFWGHGRFTHHPPAGKFPLAIAFRLADGTDPSDAMIPHGTKGWLRGYFE